MKPAGSIRRTRASSGVSPPHCSTMARAPAFTRTASVDSRSATISRLPRVADLEERVARRHERLAFSKAFEHDAVDRRRHAHHAAGRLERRRRQTRLRALQFRRGRANRERRGVGGFLGDMDVRLVRLELLFGDDAIFGKRPDAGRDPVGPGPASPWPAVPPREPGRARPWRSRRRPPPRPGVRASSSGGASARTRATTWPRFTRSPGSSSIRSTRPDTGADTMNRSRTRVTPSSSTVTTNGPRATDATSTWNVVGHKATAIRPPMTAAEPRTRRLASRRSIGVTPVS